MAYEFIDNNSKSIDSKYDIVIIGSYSFKVKEFLNNFNEFYGNQDIEVFNKDLNNSSAKIRKIVKYELKNAIKVENYAVLE